MITIELTGDDERRVNELIASGQFASAEEVLLAGMQALEWHERELETERARVAAEVEKGIEDVRAGNVGPLDMAAMRREALQQLEESQRRAG